MNKNLLINFFSIPVAAKKKPKKMKVWVYQHAGEEPQTICKERKYWYYNAPKINGGGSVGCDTLEGAKGDLSHTPGTKVWFEWIKL